MGRSLLVAPPPIVEEKMTTKKKTWFPRQQTWKTRIYHWLRLALLFFQPTLPYRSAVVKIHYPPSGLSPELKSLTKQDNFNLPQITMEHNLDTIGSNVRLVLISGTAHKCVMFKKVLNVCVCVCVCVGAVCTSS